MGAVEISSFEADATRVLSRLRSAFGAIIDALPGKTVRPHEVQKSLQIDKRLAWKIAKLIHEDDLFASARHMCGSAGVEIFLAAAARRNVPDGLIRSAREAVAGFDRLVEVHAGERAALQMMLHACSVKGRAQADLAQRKAAFAPNSYIWGVQAKTQLAALFLHPAADERLLNIAALRGFVGFRRIRPNVPWVFSRVRCLDDDGEMRKPLNLEPLDPGPDGADGIPPVPLLREFCSKPLPEVRRVAGAAGYLEDELVGTPVGDTRAITCITGEVARGAAPRYRSQQNEWADLNVRVRTPVERLIFDRFVHEDLFGPIEPELLIYGDLEGPVAGPAMRRADRDRLHTDQTVRHLGKDPAAVYTPHVPRYSEMVDAVCKKLGWERERFNLYRVRLQYPVMPTSVKMRHPLPEAPD